MLMFVLDKLNSPQNYTENISGQGWEPNCSTSSKCIFWIWLSLHQQENSGKALKMIGSVWVYSRESPLNYQRALNPAPRSDRTPLIPKWTCFVQSKATKHCMIQLFWQFFSPHTLNLGKTSESFGHFVGEVTNQVSESWVTASPASPSSSGNLSWRFPRSLRSLWFSAPSDSDNLSNCLLQHLGTFHIWPWSWKRVRLSSSKTYTELLWTS